jgi:hypothetical protein
MLKDAIIARASEVIEQLRLATGKAWVNPIRVTIDLRAKLRPKECGVAECGYRIDGAPLTAILRLDFPTGVQVIVTTEFGSDAERIVTRGGG